MMNWKKILEYLRHSLQYLFLLGVVIFISLLFPNNIRFKFRYELGQIWYYEDLSAPFDFGIRKTEAEITKELQDLKQEFLPFYRQDDTVASVRLRRYDAYFDQQLKSIEGRQFPDVQHFSETYRSYGKKMLGRIFERGIISLDTAHQKMGKNFVVNILHNGASRQQTLGNLATPDFIHRLLLDSLRKKTYPDADFLFPILEDLAVPNIRYDRQLTEESQQQMISSLEQYQGMVRKGELIVPRGGVITDVVLQKLESLKENYERQVSERNTQWGVLLGYFLITSMIIGMYVLYLRYYHFRVFQQVNELLFLFSAILIFTYLVYLIGKIEDLNIYMVPFAVVPIVIKTFYDNWLALFTHLVIVLLASFLTSQGFEFTFLQILVGMVILLTNIDPRNWTRFFNSILYVFFAYSVGYLSLALIERGGIQNFDWPIYNWIFLNAFLTLLAFPLIPLLERVFGFTSAVALVELSDMNRPLLQELALKAPGTLQHSLQVANLAEAAARRVGANHLLVRVGALYHDIGKTVHPEYFIENQSGYNPHSELSYLESARIIIGHVTEGEKMARRYRLPKVLTDFILTHHGTTLVEYFYRKFLQDNPGVAPEEWLFCYPGPKPRSKEESILMLADSIEAAAKATLKNPSPEDIQILVEKIVAGKLAQGQLDDSMLTFQELEKCKTVFRQILRSVYHARIEYPEKPTEQKP